MLKIRSNKNNLQVLYQDRHLIIVNKRVGDLVQADNTGDTPLSDVVKAFIKVLYHKPGNVYLGTVHRLDRPTTGIVVFARTSKALSRLNACFASKTIFKTYWAVVKNAPPKAEDTLVNWLKKHPKTNKSSVFPHEVKGSKKAILHYKLIKTLERYHLLEINLETGRHHQIRSQLSYIGCPIKGDLKYGFYKSNPNGGIHLHARHIAFTHPVNKTTIDVFAPLPKDAIWDACL